MEHETSQRRYESVFSSKVRAGRRRTYFFDVRRTKGEDFYITLTESTRRYNGDGYERHKIFLYKEDFNRFLASLKETIDHVKTELMPDYDYDEFTRKQEEWEAQRQRENAENHQSKDDSTSHTAGDETPPPAAEERPEEDAGATGDEDEETDAITSEEEVEGEEIDAVASEDEEEGEETDTVASEDEEEGEETDTVASEDEEEGEETDAVASEDEEEDMSW